MDTPKSSYFIIIITDGATDIAEWSLRPNLYLFNVKKMRYGFSHTGLLESSGLHFNFGRIKGVGHKQMHIKVIYTDSIR